MIKLSLLCSELRDFFSLLSQGVDEESQLNCYGKSQYLFLSYHSNYIQQPNNEPDTIYCNRNFDYFFILVLFPKCRE